MAAIFSEEETDWEDLLVWPGSTFLHELAALPNGFEWHYLGNVDVQSLDDVLEAEFALSSQNLAILEALKDELSDSQ